ncbi:MAG: Translation initiation factor 3 subunit J component [Icmadophila ericetorum]|nr:Translation initiation factor 3 subunit J component [Icmadophila ericetorum]
MAPNNRWNDDEDDSTPPSSPPVAAAIPRRNKFDDEEDDSDVLDSWDAAEDSDAEAEKAKKAAAAKTAAEAQAAANKKSKAQRIEEKRQATMRRKLEEEDESSEESEDEAEKRERLRRTEQDADLKHAEDLFGNIGINKRSTVSTVVAANPSDPTTSVNLATLPLFNPNTKDQFLKLREALAPLLSANSKKAHYTIFMQEFTKQIVKDLPSDQIKKIASGLTTLSNEKMKEEKAAEKGGKKTKAAKSKATLVATKDISSKADTKDYGDGLDE